MIPNIPGKGILQDKGSVHAYRPKATYTTVLGTRIQGHKASQKLHEDRDYTEKRIWMRFSLSRNFFTKNDLLSTAPKNTLTRKRRSLWRSRKN